MGTMLVNEVVPRLRAAASSVPAVGSDDKEEILADMTATAAVMMDSAERAGRKFSAGNIAWFASRQTRSGRRSTGSSRTDVHAPATQLEGRAHHDHLDGGPDIPSGCCECGDAPDGLYEIVWSGAADDPAEEAARNLDWEQFIASHPPRHRVAILVLAGGGTMREAGRLCGIGDSAAMELRKRIAADLLEFFGEGIVRRLLDGPRPGWSSDLRAGRERHLCHAARCREGRAGCRR
jgi:hypothetical protein